MELVKGNARRSTAIDILRALAIIGVVFNHTMDGLVTSAIMSEDSTLAAFNSALYIFRMPALAFALGLFMARATSKRGRRGYIREKVTFAAYIYLVWFVIQTGVEIATSSLKNTPRPLDSLFTIWIMPAHLWFMPFLAVAALIISWAQPWRTPGRASLTIITLGTGSIIAWGWNPAFFGLRGLSLLFFTALGATIGTERLGRILRQKPFIWLILAVVSLGAFPILANEGAMPATVVSDEYFGILGSVRSLIAATLGILLLLSISALLSKVPGIRNVLSSIGTKTLEVYLAHVIVVAGTRIILAEIGVSSAPVVLISAMILGIGAPLLLATIAKNNKLSILFQVPGSLGNWSRSANKPKRHANYPINHIDHPGKTAE